MDTPGTNSPDLQLTIEHLRNVRATLHDWYRSAETKAQLVLTVDGLFLTFITGTVLAQQDNVARTTAVFGPETWAFLVGMTLCLALSISSSVVCLASRGLSRWSVSRALQRHNVNPNDAGTYSPDIAMFFVYLDRLQVGPFAERMLTVNTEFIVRALASDVIGASGPIVAKHRWVNRAFIFTGMTLAFFLCVGVSYVLRVHAVVPARP